MNDKYFLDSDIIIYSFDNEHPGKKVVAQGLIEQAFSQQNGCISFQVTQESINVLIRHFRDKLSMDDIMLFLKEVLHPLQKVYPSLLLYENAINFHFRWKYSFYDSLIIASALNSDCTILYSEDLQDGQQIEDLKIVNPFS